MRTGLTISGTGHAVLIGWMLVGGFFLSRPPPELEVPEVTLITLEEFRALGARPPEVGEPVEALAPPPAPAAERPVAPEVDVPEPTPTVPDPVPDAPQPETLPDLSALEAPLRPDVTPAPPSPPDIPESRDSVVIAPPDAAPAPAPRVAPTPAPAPPADAAPDITPQLATRPDAEGPQAEQATEATAPPEASTRIVTEAEERETTAPIASVRPAARPERPVAPPSAPETTTTDAAPARPAPAEDPLAAAIAEAVQEAVTDSDPSPTPAPLGPPLTSTERDGLRLAVSQCWTVDPGNPAFEVVVVVGMEMNRDGTVVQNSIRLVSARGGDAGTQEIAYQAARRAVLRCQSGGYSLPEEKYDQWREIEMTFNPEEMRRR